MTLTNKEGADVLLRRRTCSRCGLPGHTVTTCTTTRVHHKVGIEIEGCWRDLNATINRVRNAHMRGCADGSVNSSDECSPYEIQTTPGQLLDALRQLHDFYPDSTNDSAGMHVHVSFLDPMCATALATQEFFTAFTAWWQAWGTSQGIPESHQFWRRLNGHNQYCRVNVESDFSDRNRVTSMDRYRAINFAAWAEHRTVEFRLLPMFRDAKVGMRAVNHLLIRLTEYLQDRDLLAGTLPTVETESLTLTQEYTMAEPEPLASKVVEWEFPDVQPVQPGFVRVRRSQVEDIVYRSVTTQLQAMESV